MLVQGTSDKGRDCELQQNEQAGRTLSYPSCNSSAACPIHLNAVMYEVKTPECPTVGMEFNYRQSMSEHVIHRKNVHIPATFSPHDISTHNMLVLGYTIYV